jgi:hypothetical protein
MGAAHPIHPGIAVKDAVTVLAYLRSHYLQDISELKDGMNVLRNIFEPIHPT